jgi:anti-anti-sigma regulatory factor
MRIGRRPFERRNAVILDLFGRLSDESDRLDLLSAVTKDASVEVILLQLEELRMIDDSGVQLIYGLAKEFATNRRRLVAIRPRGDVLLALKQVEFRLEIFENETDAFRITAPEA